MPTLPVPPTFTCSGTDSSPINYFATPAPTFNFIGETLNSSGAGLVIITPDTNGANTAIVRLDAASSIVTSASVNNNGILADTQGAGVFITTSGLVKSDEGRAIIGAVEQGTGSVFITANAPVTGGGIAADIGSGIGGLINTAASGNATVVTNALVDYKFGTGGVVAGSSAIEAGTFGTGHVSVTVNGLVNSVVDGVFGFTGLVVQPSSPGNFVQVTTGSGGVINAARIGILVEASGPAFVNVNASVTGAGGVGPIFSGFHDGIRVLSADQVTITTAAGIQVKGGDTGIFVDQTPGPGTILINNSATVIGAGTASHPVIFLATNNAATLNNMGFIFSAAGLPGDVAIGEKGGAFTLNNTGLVVGELTVSAATINNGNAWVTFGANTFGAGSSTINNSGTMVAAGTAGNTGSATDFTATGSLNVINTGLLAVSGSAAFSGLGGTSFANAGGLIDMRQGVAGDAVTVSGNFSGGAGSRLGVDTFLGGAGSKSDQLFVTGNVSGNTSIIVRDVNAGPGGFTGPGGIPIVTVTGASAPANFALDPTSTVIGGAFSPLNGGELRKGLFDYVLVDDPGHFNLVSVPNAVLFQMPVALTAAQTIWYETALGWEDRHLDLRDLQFSAAALPSLKDPQEAPVAGYPGMWVKATGSWVNRSDNANFSIGGQNFPFDLGYRQNILGLTGGVDFIDKGVAASRDIIGISLMGGYLASDLDFNKTPASFNFSGGTVAVSASYLNRGFFADLLIKTDLFNLKTGGLAFAPPGGATADATTWGVMGTTGYRLTYGPVFAEPMVTLAYTHTAIGNLSLPAAGVNVLFDDEATLRGAIGARFGAWIADTQAYGIKATLIARLWDQFQGNNRVTIANAGLPLELNDKFTEAFGEAALNLEYVSREAGVSAFLAGGLKFNEDFTAATAKAGIRYRF